MIEEAVHAPQPVHFAHSVCDEFLGYVFSAFPLSDPERADQARKKLKGRSSLDLPLVRGPFVSLSEAFAQAEAVQQMAQQCLLHNVMPSLIGYPSMYLHQQRVFEAVRLGSHVLVATGTGSGKIRATGPKPSRTRRPRPLPGAGRRR